MERMPALDALRGVAILLVMLFHFNLGPATGNPIGRALFLGFRVGGSGVDLFFVLSGFLITRILVRTKGSRGYFVNFYARRTLRIFPLYYGVLVIVLVVLPGVGTHLSREAEAHQAWLWLYGTNLYQTLRGFYAFGELDHLWSLAVEEQFYLVWPLVIVACGRRTAMGVCVGCMVAAPLVRAWLASGGNMVGAYVFTLGRVDALAAGALAALVGGMPGRGFSRAGVLMSGLAFGGLLAWKRENATMDLTTMTARFSLSAIFFGFVVRLALGASSNEVGWVFWNSRVLRFFGKYSYGLYVYHHLLVTTFRRTLPVETLAEWFGSAMAGRIAAMVVYGAVSVAVAFASWHVFEKPFLTFKRFFEREAGAGGSRGAGRALD